LPADRASVSAPIFWARISNVPVTGRQLSPPGRFVLPELDKLLVVDERRPKELRPQRLELRLVERQVVADQYKQLLHGATRLPMALLG